MYESLYIQYATSRISRFVALFTVLAHHLHSPTVDSTQLWFIILSIPACALLCTAPMKMNRIAYPVRMAILFHASLIVAIITRDSWAYVAVAITSAFSLNDVHIRTTAIEDALYTEQDKNLYSVVHTHISNFSIADNAAYFCGCTALVGVHLFEFDASRSILIVVCATSGLIHLGFAIYELRHPSKPSGRSYPVGVGSDAERVIGSTRLNVDTDTPVCPGFIARASAATDRRILLTHATCTALFYAIGSYSVFMYLDRTLSILSFACILMMLLIGMFTSSFIILNIMTTNGFSICTSIVTCISLGLVVLCVPDELQQGCDVLALVLGSVCIPMSAWATRVWGAHVVQTSSVLDRELIVDDASRLLGITSGLSLTRLVHESSDYTPAVFGIFCAWAGVATLMYLDLFPHVEPKVAPAPAAPILEQSDEFGESVYEVE